MEGDKYHVPVDEIDSIEVEWISGRINIEPYDGEEIVFSEKAFRNSGAMRDLFMRSGTIPCT